MIQKLSNKFKLQNSYFNKNMFNKELNITLYIYKILKKIYYKKGQYS